jgi:mono/diheme cytochrome c family protein
MNRFHPCTVRLATVGLLFVLICAPTGAPRAHAQTRRSPAAKGASESGGETARGKYLVEGVAMCGQCHTPRDGDGNLDRSKWLQGAPVPWTPANGAMSSFPMIAPRIGGNPPASDTDMIKLLTTGIWTNGKQLRFPMMPFRMSEADAKAVVVYLKSVTPGK